MVQKAILINNDVLGSPSRELGGVLMEAFLRNLSKREELPACVVLYNAAVLLATEGSPVVEHLRKLTERGVKLISCRTCVDYFDIESKMGAGVIEGMVSIIEVLSTHQVLTV